MSGHQHLGGPGLTQNQGNIIGDRPCVRQSRNYREHLGGNAMKDLLGHDTLKWDTTRTQGAYEGGRVYDPDRDAPGHRAGQQQHQQQQQYNHAPPQQYNNYNQQPPPQHHQQHNHAPPQMQQQPETQPGHRRGAGNANKSTYNLISGQ